MPDVSLTSPEKAEIRLLDHAGNLLQWITSSQATRMLAERGQDGCERWVRVGTKRKLHGIKAAAFDYGGPAARPVLRMPGYGCSHRRENWHNPHGVWTLDFMPESVLPIFRAVTLDLIRP